MNEENEVILYSIWACPYCDFVRNILEDNCVDFVEFDVQRNSSAAKEMLEKAGSFAVPVLDVSGKVVTGYDVKRIEALIKIKMLGSIVRR